MLTWSLGCTGFLEPIVPPAISMARLEMTSLTFMLRLGAPAGLPHHQREVVVELAADDLVGRRDDQVAPSLSSIRPSLRLASAAAFFRMPRARMISARHLLAADVESLASERAASAPRSTSRTAR